MRALLRSAVGVFAIAAAAFVAAQAEEAPKVSLKLDKTSAPVGSVVKGTLTVSFGAGLHGYQNPPTIDYQIATKVVAGKGTVLSKVTYPKGSPFLMAGEEKPSMVYADTITIPVEIKVTGKPGLQTVNLTLNYQQCTDTNCFPPSTVDASAKLAVTKPVPPKPVKPLVKKKG